MKIDTIRVVSGADGCDGPESIVRFLPRTAGHAFAVVAVDASIEGVEGGVVCVFEGV